MCPSRQHSPFLFSGFLRPAFPAGSGYYFSILGLLLRIIPRREEKEKQSITRKTVSIISATQRQTPTSIPRNRNHQAVRFVLFPIRGQSRYITFGFTVAASEDRLLHTYTNTITQHNNPSSPPSRPLKMLFTAPLSLILALAPSALLAAPTQHMDSIAALIPRQNLPAGVWEQLRKTDSLCDLSNVKLPIGE